MPVPMSQRPTLAPAPVSAHPGKAWVGPGVTLLHGDCVQLLGWWGHLPNTDLVIPKVDLVFADPPFNIGHGYDGYQDTLTPREYISWCDKWLFALHGVMSPTGTVIVASGPRYQAEIKCAMDKYFHWRQTIIWHYTFGPRQTSKFTPSWVALHVATVSDSQWAWNGHSVSVPSARQLAYKDKRAVAEGKVPNDVWALLPGHEEPGWEGRFREDQDTWLAGRVCGTFKERTPHPCQMPLVLMERLVLAYSNPGDWVLDPFVGSGTTAVAAVKQGRRAVGIDISENYLAQCVIPRLEKLGVRGAWC